jgi:hypothetical protein
MMAAKKMMKWTIGCSRHSQAERREALQLQAKHPTNRLLPCILVLIPQEESTQCVISTAA